MRGLRIKVILTGLLMAGFAGLRPSQLQAGKIGGTLGRYSLGGAGIGALLGTATATIPYLQSKETFDFITGAGAGAVVGAGVGFLFGIIDLATETAGDEEAAWMRPKPAEGLFAFQAGTTTYLAFHATF